MTNEQQDRIAVGIMTGTSLDGIDACAVELRGRGLELQARPIGSASAPLDTLAESLRPLADGAPATAAAIASARTELGRRCADLVDELALDRIDLVAVHGQTVHHACDASWQLIDPSPIAHRQGCAVVSDLRSMDRAAGGEGAPITPLADWIMHRREDAVAIVNLGGFINCTLLPSMEHPDPLPAIAGFDLCPCNHLLDAIARRCLDRPWDEGGAFAASGTTCLERVIPMVDTLASLHREARSLGSGDECLRMVDTLVDAVGGADTAATTCAAIASTLIQALQEHSPRVILLAGGGARNTHLVRAIEAAAGDAFVVSTLEHGDEREAAAMAVLGALAWDGVPITLESVTGRDAMRMRDGVWCLPRTDQTP